MLFLVGCCFCYGAMVTMWLLRRGLIIGDRLGVSGENQGSELDAVGVSVNVPVSKKIDDGMKTSKKGRDKGKGRFPPPDPSFKLLWIERKSFRASILIPGRKIRVTEMLPDRTFSADFNSYELSWVIAALREASRVNSGKFSKLSSMGRRTMAVKSVTNRAGVFLQLSCSVEGRNSRLLCIPAGKNRDCWEMLATYLDAVANGGKIWVKKKTHSVPSTASCAPFHHREASETIHDLSIDSDRRKLPSQVVSGWTGGFLPAMLKSGFQTSLGEPYSSGEVDRSFLWKTHLSEIGPGIIVVEQFPDDLIVEGCEVRLAGVAAGDISGELGAEGAADEADTAHGAEEEDTDVSLSDAVFDSTLGNLIPKVLNLCAVDVGWSVLDKDPLASGPPVVGFDQRSFDDARVQLNSLELSGALLVRAEDIHFANGSAHQEPADASVYPSLGELMGLGTEFMGSGYSWAEEVPSCRISGGLASASEAKSYHFESNGMGSFLGNVLARPVGSPDSRFLARIEDITIFDNDETLSFDSPVSDYSARVAAETSSEVGVRCLEDSCVICGSPEPCGESGGSVRW